MSTKNDSRAPATDPAPSQNQAVVLRSATQTRGRHLSNIFDPSHPDARRFNTYSFHAMESGPAAIEEEWKYHLQWIEANIVGPPKATTRHTVEELEAMNYVGIYAPADR